VRAATILLFLVSAFLLASLGGAAIVAAPVTLPLLYVAVRRHPTKPFRVTGGIIGALTILEVGWATAYVVVGEDQPWIVVVPLGPAAATLVLFLGLKGRRAQHAG
jgi:hypothetical protein